MTATVIEIEKVRVALDEQGRFVLGHYKHITGDDEGNALRDAARRTKSRKRLQEYVDNVKKYGDSFTVFRGRR